MRQEDKEIQVSHMGHDDPKKNTSGTHFIYIKEITNYEYKNEI